MEKAPHDPVLSSFEFSLRRIYYPYGFPLEIQTNSSDVIAAAEEGWGAFEQAFFETPVRLALGVIEGTRDRAPLPDSVFRSREHLMSIFADHENFIVCDFRRGFAFGWVTESTAADHPLVRYRFLLSGGATLVEQRAFAAMHGALVVRKGIGVMLAGDSFAGKSTLAYACARAGWTYVSDDGAFLVRERNDRYVIGDPHSIRFRPDAPRLFPELADHMPIVRPNGKVAIEVRTADLGLKTSPACRVDHIVWLNRGDSGQARVRPTTKDGIAEEWAPYSCYGAQEVRDAQRRCHARMLTAQLWEMQYSDLDDAVTRLEQLVDSGA
ncbi:MAG TPA: hypothetical protein VFW44_02465 [Bryobacteraceae bacterium]|nr:hypothetical protein [Bryobacteraceae bacterium]